MMKHDGTVEFVEAETEFEIVSQVFKWAAGHVLGRVFNFMMFFFFVLLCIFFHKSDMFLKKLVMKGKNTLD